jgi:capsule biosynthesis phosphatase
MVKSTFVMDIDGTICVASRYPDETSPFDYANAVPIKPVIKQLQKLKAEGHTVILHTARGMKTYKGDVAAIEANVRPVLEDWLKEHEVPYDTLVMGKPWGPNVYYVDDKALSPSDFAYQPIENYESITIRRFVKP